MADPLLHDDVVATAADIRPGAPPPLVIKDRLESFLDERGLGAGAIEVTRIGNGQSCETFLLQRKGLEAVLRRAPRPPLTRGVQNIERETRILVALNGAARAPRVLAHSSQPEVLGVPFLIMERVAGMVVDHGLPPELQNPAERARVCEELVDALVELRACDVHALGLADISRPTIDHLQHIESLRKIWEKNATRILPDCETLRRWLVNNVPPGTQRLSLVHSDYRFGNVLFAASAPTRLTAVLDWETTILGDPLIDVGYLVGLHREAGDTAGLIAHMTPVPLGPGALGRDQMAQRYAERSGASIAHLPWYIAFALWRMVVVGEGLYRRFLEGKTQAPFWKDFKYFVPEAFAIGLRWAAAPDRFR